jgi:peptidoglycan-associated lipoprotein
MRQRHDTYLHWVVIATVMAFLTVSGCSKRNVVATTSGADGGQTTAKGKGTPGSGRSGDLGGGDQRGGDSFGLETPREENLLGKAETGIKAGGDTGTKGGDTSRHVTESLGPIGTGPLQGFNKSTGEERLSDTPLLIAKAEPQDSMRKARDDNRRELADIYFAFDKWMLSNEGKKNLANSADFLKQNPNAKLVIEGYCDERGSREYNLVLGEKRAKEARRFLADLGIQNPVSVTSYGKERQVCNERDEACYWKNRRAHLLLDAEK